MSALSTGGLQPGEEAEPPSGEGLAPHSDEAGLHGEEAGLLGEGTEGGGADHAYEGGLGHAELVDGGAAAK